MENIFNLAESCLHHSDVEQKIQTTHYAKQLLEDNRLSFESKSAPLTIAATQFPDKPALLMPKDMPNRRLNSSTGKAAFFHALAHIEFVAIYLAWDILYRFRGLPDQFYQDWVTVADEEALHFSMIRHHMSDLNTAYGDLPAHHGLWDHASDTADHLLARLAIVPRCMEARGLDVTPEMIKKFDSMGDQGSVLLLSRILEDEVGHVKTGSFWFTYICELQGLNPEQTYQNLISKYYIGKPKGPFNRNLRIIAGFSDAEIDWLELGI